MRVLHLSTSLNGGAGRAAYRIHESLLASNIDSQILTLSGPNEATKSSSVKIVERTTLERLKSRTNVAFQRQLMQKGEELVTPISVSLITRLYEEIDKFDVINLHNLYNLISLEEIARCYGSTKKVVITLHDQRFLTGGCHYTLDCTNFLDRNCIDCPQVKEFFKRTIEQSFQRSQLAYKEFSNLTFVAPSSWLLDRARRARLNSNANFFLIRNPISKDFFTQRAPARTSKQLVFAFISMELWNPYKGLDILISALLLIKDSSWFADKKFIFIGEGKIEGLPEYVKFEQLVIHDDSLLASTLSSVDVVIVPSKQDNFPNVVPESLLSGCDLITSNAGGVAELSSPFSHKVFPSGDIKSLSDSILAYRPNLSMCNSRITQARDFFSTSRIAEAYRNVYES